MKVWGNGRVTYLDGYSHVDKLLSTVIEYELEGSLTPAERLFVVLGPDMDPSPKALAGLYVSCACYEDAREGFTEIRHHRKLGDMAWALGETEAAVQHYLDVSTGFQTYRKQADYDRLIRLAFIEKDWPRFWQWFSETPFEPCGYAGQVVLGNTFVSEKPYLEMLAVAERYLPAGLKSGLHDAALAVIEDSFFADEENQWEQIRSDPAFDDPQEQERIRSYRLPIVCRSSPRSTVEVLKEGDTERARKIAGYIRGIDQTIDEAQEYLESYGKTGDPVALKECITRVTGSGIDAMTETVFFATIGHNSFEAEADRIEALRLSDPVITRYIDHNRQGRTPEGRKVY